MTVLRAGIIGCGNIAPRYVTGCRRFDVLDLVACADLDAVRAAALAEEHDLRALPVAALLEDPELDILINLTPPRAHAAVSLAVIEAGKHLYSEKPLATRLDDGRRILEAARKRGVRVGCAPDTFLGGSQQTCRRLVDQGWIGEPVAATAFVMSHGMESWHPNPAFFYQQGAGPMLDMGPYYLTALVNLLGPARQVTGMAGISFPERVVTSQPRAGERIVVETPTHVTGLIEFVGGAMVTIIASFDIWHHNLPHLEIHGSEGSLSAPDPNWFGGPVRGRRPESEGWEEVPLTHSTDVARGIGVADMAYGILHERPHRASGEMALHVLEIMHAILAASESGRHVEIASRCDRPVALPSGLAPGRLDP